MKFCTYRFRGETALGLVDAEARRVHPIDPLAPALGGDMIELIRRYDQIKPAMARHGAGLDFAEIELLAPLHRPRRNIFCVGKNYREHAHEFSRSGFDASAQPAEAVPDVPIVFTKAANTVIGLGATIENHRDITRELDYEAELAVVIGRGGRAIAPAAAFDHVWGYTIINDVTARDLQKRHRQWFLGKSLDGFCPMGPWIATRDELDARDIEVRCWVNGELRQQARTRDLIFDIPTLIATLSAGITLEPGDVIATGTPAGVGIGFNPPKFLQPGDEVRIAIDGIGELVNRVA